ncbi:MAG: SdrD B-like domain-containing protein, partial [Pirellulales bacterium]
VDEQGFLGPNAVAEGNEFEGSKFTGTFTAPHFFEATSATIFFDAYDELLAAGGLDLPPDSYQPPAAQPLPVMTAGAFLSVTQVPLPISISGTVFEDRNVNNVREAADPGLAGVQLTLEQFDGGKYVATGQTAVTDAAGNYRFEGLLPGRYRVVESQPSGYFSVGARAGQVGGGTRGTTLGPDVITDIELLGGEDSIRNNFAEALPSLIRGRVHADRDGDCVYDQGEILISGVSIELLDAAGSVIARTTTDSQGQYEFANLAPGTYGVFEVQPAGYFDSGDHVGSAGGRLVAPDSIVDIVLVSGTLAIDYNFCEHEPVSLGGTVYVDDNDNGLRGASEPGIAGVTLVLLGANGSPLGPTTTTDAQGAYLFSNLAPGVYGVAEIQPAGLFDGRDAAGTAGGTAQNPGDRITGATLTPGVHGRDYNFGELRPASIRGLVHADRNGDCVPQDDEPRLAGVVVQLLDAQGNVLATTTTNSQGQYAFENLVPGTYGIRELQPAGYLDSGDHVGSAGGRLVAPDSIVDIVLASGTAAVDYNFCELEPASIAGIVFADRNGDSLHQPGEPLLAGVTIQLLGPAAGVVASMATDSQGRYAFEGLAPGVYGIRELQPAGYFDGPDQIGSAGGTRAANDLITGITLGANVDAVNYNFVELEPASIAGMVYADTDGDGLLGPGEAVLPGVVIQLLGNQGQVLATTITGPLGRYIFQGLTPGRYGIRELQPAGYFDGPDHVGSAGGILVANDLITGIQLGAAVRATDYNFAEIPPGAISGFVFQDGADIELENVEAELPGLVSNLPSIRDGQRKPTDRPIAGVRLRLADATGVLLLDGQGNPMEAETNAAGFYIFTGLPPGLYTVLEVQPAGYIDGLDTAGSLGGIAINPGLIALSDPSGFMLLSPALLAMANSDAIALIPLGAGRHSIENNFGEIRVVERPNVPFIMFPPAPTPPSLQVIAPALRDPLVFNTLTPMIVPLLTPLYSGGGGVVGFTWHLSVVDAGRPRGDRGMPEGRMHLTSVVFDSAAWQKTRLTEGTWIFDDRPSADEAIVPPGEEPADAVPLDRARRFVFGRRGATPVTGDFDGDGLSEVGVFIDGEWFIDLNGNGVWDEGDLWIGLGSQGDLPVTGDWDGDGKTDIGVFGKAWPGDPRAVAAEPGLPGPRNMTAGTKNMPPSWMQATLGWRTMKRTRDGELRADVIDHVFHYGTAGDIPVTGDWTGSGVDTIGVFREGRWALDVDGDGKWTGPDLSFEMGSAGDLPIVGDFDGDGIDEVGVYRDGLWRIDVNHDRVLDERDLIFELGGRGDQPVVGDFNGDGIDQPGLYRELPGNE